MSTGDDAALFAASMHLVASAMHRTLSTGEKLLCVCAYVAL
jgi:hypothetical protein